MESIYPVVEGYKDYPAYGFRINLSDSIFLNRLHLVASYTPNEGLPSNERTHIELAYERYDWRAKFTLNDADFYDLFGPTKVSRKGYSLGVGYKKTLIYDAPRNLDLNTSITAFGNLESLPRYQNIDATFDKLVTATAHLSYSNLRASIAAVDYEKGLKAEAVLLTNYVNSDLIPQLLANFDIGLALPLRNSSLWLRSSAGVSDGDVEDPFANFFFGGFGNNKVDHGAVKRYRKFYAFPGLGLNQAGGRNYVKTVIDWNLPPIHFKRAGTPGFYLTTARTSLFAGGLATNLDGPSPSCQDLAPDDRPFDCPEDLSVEVANIGIQVDLRFTVLSALDMTFSVGYAVAGAHDVESNDEFMFSLKILR